MHDISRGKWANSERRRSQTSLSGRGGVANSQQWGSEVEESAQTEMTRLLSRAHFYAHGECLLPLVAHMCLCSTRACVHTWAPRRRGLSALFSVEERLFSRAVTIGLDLRAALSRRRAENGGFFFLVSAIRRLFKVVRRSQGVCARAEGKQIKL